MHPVICKYANTMRANILYAASTWRKERSRQKKTRVKQRRRRRVVTGRAEVKKEQKKEREKNGQSLDGSACPAGIALHAGLKTSARNIATAKALICNLLPLPSAFYRATFPRMRRWNGMPKRSKDNTVKTHGSPQWSTRDDTLLKYTCDRAKQLKPRKTVSFDICGEANPYLFYSAECFYVTKASRQNGMCYIYIYSLNQFGYIFQILVFSLPSFFF